MIGVGICAISVLGFSQINEKDQVPSNLFDKSGEIGRYQLARSEHWVGQDDRSVPITLKIDTATGETWTLEAGALALDQGFRWVAVK